MESKPHEPNIAPMTHRTVVLSSYEEFLASENDHSEEEPRQERLSQFPYSVMLQVAYPELGTRCRAFNVIHMFKFTPKR